ncbi:hypothetical protein SLEP1_g42088 [Rubroshorea leprosula]|uniref:Uncharacterized protein n=1 Tax=Rubroshorea leprosula TaxID=152421 RepID=A0AAV5L8M5_9ROSI|nr:hypothetical protein SLEP1_g42088 [Rubroshorea leprosula]
MPNPKLPKVAKNHLAFSSPQSWNHPNRECVGAIAVNCGICHLFCFDFGL